jgi:hypothetical protein
MLTCTVHHILLELITLTIFDEAYKLMKLSIKQSSTAYHYFLPPCPLTSSIYVVSIIREISLPYNTGGKIVTYILIFKSLERGGEDKKF